MRSALFWVVTQRVVVNPWDHKDLLLQPRRAQISSTSRRKPGSIGRRLLLQVT